MSWILAGGGVGHFGQLCSPEHLFASWDKFVRGKRGKADTQQFARNLEENIFELRDELLSVRYRHGSYEPFIVHDPKRRQIHKADVRDRLVHQAVFDISEPLFEPGFIYDSFSCRKGKGTHAGVNRLRQFLRQASRNDTQTVYALKCDVKQLFASVEHSKLLDLLSISITDGKILKLLEGIIKSFEASPDRGIPLGNLTSQLFANVYMHELDRFVKHGLREKYYVRYCDDFIIVNSDRQKLIELVEPIQEYLASNLGLALHPDKVLIRSWHQGVDFLGNVLKPHCTLLRTKTRKRMLKRTNSVNVSSYLGMCKHADAYEIRQLVKIRAYENSNYYAFSGDV